MTSHALSFDAARTALKNLADRWAQLPLAQAEEVAPQVRALAHQCRIWQAELCGPPPQVLRDLGPATALNQLVVCANELMDCAHTHSPTTPNTDRGWGRAETAQPAEQLTRQLRALLDSLHDHRHSLAPTHTHRL